MENKYFLHRIRKEGENYTTGIEVHDTLDAAIQSFHSQMKIAYDNPSYPNLTYVSCMVTDGNDAIIPEYSETWSKTNINDFFVHYIRKDGENYTKGIDVQSDYGAACRTFHTYMEYGYNNSKFPDITFVSSKIMNSDGFSHKENTWSKIN